MQQYFQASDPFIEKFQIEPYQEGELSKLKFAVKDCIDINNKVTGFGNPTWLKKHSPSTANAICVELLLAHGATCVGKTITDEFTYSLLGENYFYGTPLNPKCPDRIPGGSSSGSASSVASKMVDFALGTDTGGSIRVPASHCGIYGYRPTYGRISTAGVLPLAPSLDTVGILANEFSVLEKSAYVLLSTAINQKVSNQSIVVLEDALNACPIQTQERFLNYIDNTLKNFKVLKLADIISPEVNLKWLFDLYSLLHSSELWSVYGVWIESVKPELGPIAEYNFYQIAKKIDRKKIPEGIKKREWFTNKLQDYLNNSILCFPTTPDVAPKKGLYSQHPEARKLGDYFQHLIGINAMASLSRSPQITIPLDDLDQLPVGASFLAGRFQDESLFNFVRNLI